MRIPGEGTDQLINRRQEAAVYQTIASTAGSVMRLPILTRRTATKSQNISKVRGSAMQKMRKIFRNA